MTKQFLKYTKFHYNYALINHVNFAPVNLVVNDPNSVQVITLYMCRIRDPPGVSPTTEI